MVEVGVVDTRLAAATLSGRGARVYTCTCVHDNIPCRCLPNRPIGASLLTTSPQQGCLALKGLHTGASMGIVTGIRGVLVFINKQLAKYGEECKFCFAVEDSKAKKLSASGAPGNTGAR